MRWWLFGLHIHHKKVAPVIRASNHVAVSAGHRSAEQGHGGGPPTMRRCSCRWGSPTPNELGPGARALNFLTAWLSRQPAFAKARAPASIWPSPEASYGVPLRAAAIRRLALESLLQRACHGESFEEAFMHGPCLLSQPLLRLRLTRRCCRRCFRKPGRSRTPVSACPTR